MSRRVITTPDGTEVTVDIDDRIPDPPEDEDEDDPSIDHEAVVE